MPPSTWRRYERPAVAPLLFTSWRFRCVRSGVVLARTGFVKWLEGFAALQDGHRQT